MKNSTPFIICILICLVPTLLAGQALQVQNQLISNGSTLRELQLKSSQSTMSPLLRVSNIGSSGQDGVSIELNSLSLMNPGPSVLFDCPDPLIPGSGSIRLQPSEASTSLRILNIGSSGQDGVSIDLGDAVVAPYRPRISMRKPLVAGTQSAIVIEPGEDTPYLAISNIGSSGQDGVQLTVQDDTSGKAIFGTLDNDTGAIDFVRWGAAGSDSVGIMTFFDLELPGLMERISSASLDSFFDVFYDLNLGSVGTGFGQNPNNICAVRTFNPTTPSLLERISSNLPAVQSFFDVFVDLDLGTETRRLGTPGDPDFDLLSIRTYDKATPKLLERIASASLDSFFDVFYDLNLGTVGTGFGQNPNNICAVRTFNPSTPSLLERISSNLPAVQSFFDVFVDLDLGTETRRLGTPGDPDFDLLSIRTYDKATPKLIERIASASLDSFFDVFYDLSLATTGVGFGFEPDDLCLVHKFENEPPRLQTKIQSSDPLYLNSFFDISYDLELGTERIEHNNLVCITEYDASKSEVTIESLLPGISGFFDIEYDLDLGIHKTEHNGLSYITQYNESDWDFISRVTSNDPLLSFHDDIIDLGSMSVFNSFTDNDGDLLKYGWICDPNGPAGTMVVASGNASFSDFHTTYDLSTGKYAMEHNDVLCEQTFDPGGLIHRMKIASFVLFPPQYFEIITNISNPDLIIQSNLMGSSGMQTLEMRYEYDALSRKVKEVSTDLENGFSLSLERRLSPTGSSLFISEKLEVQGTVSTPGPGPLVIADNVMVTGTNHQITGSTTVTGMLQVNAPPGTPHQINGNLQVVGNFSATGTKAFKIDHPLDPDNKYLVHSCVESPDMMNVYNGNAVTNNEGYATINLPDYFEALNSDFRYQLTCIGQFAQAMVDQKIKNNKFIIRTDKPNVEVSWQVTGIRNDPASQRQAYAVEIEKEPYMKGQRLYDDK